MSGPFETRLAQRVIDALSDRHITTGDRFVAEFDDPELADNFAQALYHVATKEQFSITSETTDETVPGFRINEETIIYAVRVHSDSPTPDWLDHDITQGFATNLRNTVASNDADAALLLIFPSGVEIDTLDTTTDLLGENGWVSLQDFRSDLLYDMDGLESNGEALISALQPYFESNRSSTISDLKTLCNLYEALESDNSQELPSIIPSVGHFIREDRFDDWSDRSKSREDLESRAKEILQDNQQHANYLSAAHAVGVDTFEQLSEHYEEDFARRISQSSDEWKNVTHTQARCHFKESDNGPNGHPTFESLEINAKDSRVYSSGSTSAVRRGILAVPSEGEFTLSVIFSDDVSDQPMELVDGEERDIGSIAVENEEITVTFGSGVQDEPEFGSLKIYIGHKTTRGQPKCEFHIALLPEWFYQASSDNSLDVDVEQEALVSDDQSELKLRYPGDDTFEEVVVEGDGTDITFDRSITILPDPPAQVAKQEVAVYGEGPVPVMLNFNSDVAGMSTEEVDFPLVLSAIANPENWASNDLQVSDSMGIDTNTGELHPPNSQGIEFPEDDLRLLQIEDEIRNKGDPRGRIVEGTTPSSGEIDNPNSEIPDELESAYEALFDHFNSRGRTPSTDQWDDKTKERVRNTLNAFESAINGIPSGISPLYDNCTRLGTIESTTTDVKWLTPYHPVLLAYGLRIAEWRDNELLPTDKTAGFQNNRFLEMFDPSGLLPYSWGQDGDHIHARMRSTNHLWLRYDQVGEIGSETPQYLKQVVADKFEAFQNAFPILFDLHPERQIVVNLINMGDLGPVIEGLFDYINALDRPCPPILFRIYGGQTEGEEMEKFFSEAAESDLQETLTNRDEETVDTLQERVFFVRRESYQGEDAKPAHITFFRGILHEQPMRIPNNTLPSGLHRDGLIPQESILVTRQQDEIISKVGYGDDEATNTLLRRIARLSNALEAKGTDAYTDGKVLSKQVSSAGETELDAIWDNSLWVSHIEPKVGIDFYLESEANSLTSNPDDTGTLMIHYSDQYNASSPNFDVITTTRKRDPYVQAIRTALRNHDALAQLDPETVLRQLVAIDGALALDLLRAEGTRVTELIGFVGGLAVSQSILRDEFPDHVWIPVSLAELARHDRSRRYGDQGILQYDSSGPASDDICLLGVPDDPDEYPELKLWIVETKGGHSPLAKGREQVINARTNLENTFHPDQGFADPPLVRSEFGKLIEGITDRLNSYGTISPEAKQKVEKLSDSLRDGEYSLSFLRDDAGHIGEVIRVRRDKEFAEFNSKDRVRTLELPIECIRVLRTGVRLEDIVPGFNIDQLSFGNRRADRRATSVDTAPSDDQGQTATTDTSETRQRPAAHDQEPNDSPDTSPTVTDSPTDQPKAETERDQQDTTDSTRESSSESDEITASAQTPKGYDWTEDAFREFIESMEESPSHDLDVNVSKLVDDLTSEFNSLGVDVHRPNPADVSIGPRKIGVNIHPKQGQKIEGILKSLNSISVHIQAQGTITGEPNPAEGAVRIEIPHSEPRDVYLRDAFESVGSHLFEPLRIPLGVTSENEHRTLNLVDERHALIAGSTGSGKSNFLSTVISSLALTQSPSEVSMSLLDPKGVDFQRFSGLPHVGGGDYLDTPESCVDYLFEIVEAELQQRQDLLKEYGAPNIREFNQFAADDYVDADQIPYRVIVIDEYADLIMSVDDSDRLENAVTRIAQKGRAMGYIMLLATQRPSADIVSGNIKTNFPCRISFRLPSNTDSRVILDKPGAEDLQGSGDMIAISQSGREHHLQGYRLPPRDANQIRENFESS